MSESPPADLFKSESWPADSEYGPTPERRLLSMVYGLWSIVYGRDRERTAAARGGATRGEGGARPWPTAHALSLHGPWPMVYGLWAIIYAYGQRGARPGEDGARRPVACRRTVHGPWPMAYGLRPPQGAGRDRGRPRPGAHRPSLHRPWPVACMAHGPWPVGYGRIVCGPCDLWFVDGSGPHGNWPGSPYRPYGGLRPYLSSVAHMIHGSSMAGRSSMARMATGLWPAARASSCSTLMGQGITSQG